MLRTLTIKTNKNWDFNNQAKNLVKNGTGSRFGRKIGRDGGIEKKKKAGKRDLRTPIVDPQISASLKVNIRLCLDSIEVGISQMDASM